jgi:hypothetical protein
LWSTGKEKELVQREQDNSSWSYSGGNRDIYGIEDAMAYSTPSNRRFLQDRDLF